MCKKVGYRISLVSLLLIVIPLSLALEGNSSSYEVVISDFGVLGYENTIQPNDSIEINMESMPIDEGNSSSNYTVAAGISKMLGPIAFEISNLTPYIARNDSIVNCTGINAFSHNKFEMPKHLYRFTGGDGSISTEWSESGTLDCLSVGGCEEPNLTCHFKVDDSHMNSTETTASIIVDTTPPNITLISPDDEYIWYESLIVVFYYNVTDAHNISSCELIINGASMQNKSNPEKDAVLNFTQLLELGEYTWSVNCTDEVQNEQASEFRNITTRYETISLSGIGITGYENISEDYTASRSIIISSTYLPTADYCRFKNEEDGVWSEWAHCEKSVFWMLNDGAGNKTVFGQINHTGIDIGIITNQSDWITLEPNATHLDVTPPENFTVYDDGGFTNSNDSLHFMWDMPVDTETEILNGVMTFEYMLKDSNGTDVTGWNTTNELEISISGISLVENHTYILLVNATNPAGLKTQSISDGIIIDLTAPVILTVFSLPDNLTWSNNYSFINWSANDSLSGVAGYSMILDTINDTEADDMPETNYTNNRTYTDKEDGEYYFHIRAFDNAGNFGETVHYGPVMIDKTPPSVPIVINSIELASAAQIIFYWQASTDESSGVKEYNLTITNNDTGIIYTASVSNLNYTFGAEIGDQYFLIVQAIDNAGNSVSSQLPSISPLTITSAMPDGSVIIKEKPIIRVETNKIAICKEDYTGEDFIFTNSTYHETRLNQANNDYTITITCTGSDGFSAVEEIEYTLSLSASVSGLSINSVNSPFVGGLVNASINVSGESQVEKNRFIVSLDDEEFTDFTVYEKDNLGNYILQFTAKEAGSFSLKVNVGGEEDEETLLINNLNLNIEYTGATPMESKSHLVYANKSDKKVGLASDSKEVFATTNAGKIILNSSAEGKAYLFFTKNNFNVNTKDKQLKDNEFTRATNAFGYPSSDTYKVSTALGYESIVIQGLKELPAGSYSIFVKNIGQDSKNKTIIMIELE